MNNIGLAMLEVYMAIQSAKHDDILKMELKAGLQNIAQAIADLYPPEPTPTASAIAPTEQQPAMA